MEPTASMTEIVQYVGHKADIPCIAVSADGKHVLTGSFDRTARLWDAATGVELRQFRAGRIPDTQFVISVALTPDCSKALVATWKHRVYLWEIETGETLFEVEHPARKAPWPSPFAWLSFPAAFSHDGRKFATGSTDRTARIWHSDSGALICVIDGIGADVTAVAFSPNGSLLLVGTSQQGVSLWDATTGAEVRWFQRPEYAAVLAVSSVQMSSDGRLVLAGGYWGYAQLWQTDSGEELRRFGAERPLIQSAALSPDSRIVAISSDDRRVRLWDVETSSQIACLDCRLGTLLPAAFLPVAFSPEGSFLVSGSARNVALRHDMRFLKERKRGTP